MISKKGQLLLESDFWMVFWKFVIQRKGLHTQEKDTNKVRDVNRWKRKVRIKKQKEKQGDLHCNPMLNGAFMSDS